MRERRTLNTLTPIHGMNILIPAVVGFAAAAGAGAADRGERRTCPSMYQMQYDSYIRYRNISTDTSSITPFAAIRTSNWRTYLVTLDDHDHEYVYLDDSSAGFEFHLRTSEDDDIYVLDRVSIFQKLQPENKTDSRIKYVAEWIAETESSKEIRWPIAPKYSNKPIWFDCEYVEFTLKNLNSPGEDNSNGEPATTLVTFRNLNLNYDTWVAHDECFEDHYNPCDAQGKPNAVCRAVDGNVACMEEQEGPPPNGTYFMPGITRREFYDTYRCLTHSWEPEPEPETFLQWPKVGAFPFFQASNVNATLVDGTRYTFKDDRGKPQQIGYSLAHDEISRADDWFENGTERRLALKFDVVEPDANISEPGGWKLNHLRMYSELEKDGCQEFIWWRDPEKYQRYYYSNAETGVKRNDIAVQLPHKIFSCDYMEFNLLSESFSNNNEIRGTFTATNVFIGAMMDKDVKVCDASIYHPCQDNATHPLCVAIDGVVECVSEHASATTNSSSDPTELLCNDTHKIAKANMTSSFSDTHFIHWEAENYLLEAHAALVYKDGRRISFHDEMNRHVCFDSYASEFGFGSFGRNRYWTEGTVDRYLSFDFMKFSGGGWRLRSSQTETNDLYCTDTLYWNQGENDQFVSNGGGIQVHHNDVLFYCDYVEFDYKKSLYLDFDENGNAAMPVDDDELVRQNERILNMSASAKFVAYNVTIGGFLQDGYAISQLKRHNPCAKEGKWCSAINGKVNCVDSLPPTRALN